MFEKNPRWLHVIKDYVGEREQIFTSKYGIHIEKKAYPFPDVNIYRRKYLPT